MGSPAHTGWFRTRLAEHRRGLLAVWVRQHQHCVIVFLICAVTVGATWHRAWRSAQAEHERELDRTADIIRDEIREQFLKYERLLHIARALFDASDEVTRTDWELFARGLDLGLHTPGLHGFGFVAKVEPADLAAFVLGVRAGGMPEFRIRPHREADRDNTGHPSYIILYSEPSDRNTAALGVDVATYARNRQVYHDSARDRCVRMVAGISLVQSDQARQGLVAVLPVFTPPTPEGRVTGWVTAAVVLEEFFELTWVPDWDGNILTVSISDDSERPLLYRSTPGAHGTDADLVAPAMERTREIDLFGQKMRVGVTPASRDLSRADMAEADVVLLVGSLATALLTLIAWSATRTRQRAITIARQMTESLRISEQRQRELAAKAELANQAKSEFLANMSHEIRTPMTAILGYADIVEARDADPGERAEAVRAIRRSGQHLLTIINDVLDLSKIESGRLQISEETSDVGVLVNDVLGGLRPQADRKGLRVSARLDTPVPELVITDTHRVRQVLINLVGNAIKFTETGGVDIVVTYRLGRLRLSVRDTGVGIAPEKLDLVFQPFEQADNSMTRRHEGTGLGLTISRRLAALLGGELTASSREGHGSVFILDIPAPPAEGSREITALPRPAAAPAENSEPALRITGARVLLAEDGPDNQKLISFILSKAGMEVDVVSNGRQAVDRIAAGHAYDLLITDMQMPEMDGYAAARLLRADGYDRPILALTAHAMEGDRERCLQAGCDDYETKPIDRTSLLRTIERLLGGPRVVRHTKAA
jgi:signal transduction histidine kinase/ActR/RegA family two-component response regulator